MKKINIITFHFPHNSGAVLQCWALQQKLGIMGYEVEIVDYRPSYHTDMYKPFRNPFKSAYIYVKNYNQSGKAKALYMYTRHFYSICKSNLFFYKTKQRAHVFSAFIHKYLKLTDRYDSFEDLAVKPPRADVYICGSDQIWNSDITNGSIDHAYYLDFGSINTKRIAYAVSADIKQNERELVVRLLMKFEAISVRENDSKAQLQDFENKEISVQIDPTLLLNMETYDTISKNVSEKEYILFYGLKTRNTQTILQLLKEVKTTYKLPIIDISPVNWKTDAKLKKPVTGPDEFLGYIRNALVVVTNSFHGTAFSLIYHKEFWCSVPSLKGSRITDLLKKTGLEHRMIQSDEDFSNIAKRNNINYDLTENILTELKHKAEAFLIQAIEQV